MKNREGSIAFCIGCKFAGGIPLGESINRSVNSTLGEVNAVYLLDDQIRISNGIAHSTFPEQKMSDQLLMKVIGSCNGKKGCKLENEGFVPLDIDEDNDLRVEVVELYLNELEGVKSLGRASIEATAGEDF